MNNYDIRHLVKHMVASGELDAELHRLIDSLDVPESVKDNARLALAADAVVKEREER